MTDTGSDIIELRFEGNGISPELVKPSEVASLLVAFEKSLLSQIKHEQPGADIDEILFSFESIQNNSLDLLFKPLQLKDIILSSYIAIASSFSTGDYSKINKSSLNPLKEILKFSKKHNCSGHFVLNDKELSSFSSDFQIEIGTPNNLIGDTTIYGKIIRVGGEEPKIHFRFNTEDKLIFDVDEGLAKKLSPKLYEDIGLVGEATWNADSFSIENFKVKEVIELERKSISTTFKELSGLIGKYWDEIEDVENYI